MIVPLMAQECADVTLRSVDTWIESGMCWRCALIATSTHFKIELDKLEALWLDRETVNLDGIGE